MNRSVLQELLSQLCVADQHEMDKLNDDIRRLTQENKSAFATRMKLEADKNKLENLLTNNLIRRRDELVQVLIYFRIFSRNYSYKFTITVLLRLGAARDFVGRAKKNARKQSPRVSWNRKKVGSVESRFQIDGQKSSRSCETGMWCQ